METFYLTDTGKVREHNEDNVIILNNDKGEYFCPECGGPIEIVMYERYGEKRRGCPRCHKFFDDSPY